MDFITMPAGTHELGWRFSDALPDDVRNALDEFMPLDEILTRFSPRRTVELSEYTIATTTRSAEELLEELDEATRDEIDTLEDLCNVLDEKLLLEGLRLPTEDELEAACGGSLFPWGDAMPPGIPWGDQTTFDEHKQPNGLGLTLNDDPYKVEIARLAFKLGDGGEALCGAYPWPVPWLSFSPSFCLTGDAAEECLFEFLETARVRPVRCSVSG